MLTSAFDYHFIVGERDNFLATEQQDLESSVSGSMCLKYAGMSYDVPCSGPETRI